MNDDYEEEEKRFEPKDIQRLGKEKLAKDEIDAKDVFKKFKTIGLAHVPKDDGYQKHSEEKKEIERKKKASDYAPRGSLGDVRGMYHGNEKEIYFYYVKHLREEVIKLRGEVTFMETTWIELASRLFVRIQRKDKLEAQYGRFLDRIATQDPYMQVEKYIAKLGLDKKVDANSGTDMISQLISQQNQRGTHEEWKKNKIDNKQIAPFKLRDMSELDIKEDDED